MDELTLFKGAPEHLINQEKYLMAHADIVFTGGKSLYESKSRLHPNVHCFPSSVDESHFAAAIADGAFPDDIKNIGKPVVGYFGVIDERLDLSLLSETAARLPEVHFAMIGPLEKIEESDLPQADNIHYLGMKSYEELPFYLKAFNVAMMPFALNEATKYISPTKTLEYMSAGKPIISTRITDVVRDYHSCVNFVDNAAEFAAAISRLLAPNFMRKCFGFIRRNNGINFPKSWMPLFSSIFQCGTILTTATFQTNIRRFLSEGIPNFLKTSSAILISTSCLKAAISM